METSIFLAKLLGLIYTVIGIGMVLNSSYFKKSLDDMMKNSAMIYLGGIMSLLIGFFMITYHNVWVYDWPVVITVFGWMALLKGILLFWTPKFLSSIAGVFVKNVPIIGVFVLVLGILFGSFGLLA